MTFRPLRSAIAYVPLLLLPFFLMALPANADSGSGEKKTMTGVWLTQPVAPFVSVSYTHLTLPTILLV